jgi:hypothetical protein
MSLIILGTSNMRVMAAEQRFQHKVAINSMYIMITTITENAANALGGKPEISVAERSHRQVVY